MCWGGLLGANTEKLISAALRRRGLSVLDMGPKQPASLRRNALDLSFESGFILTTAGKLV